MNKNKNIKILITGPPGSGKSTFVSRLIDDLISRGYTVGGILTPEIRERRRRIGFKIIDLLKKREGVMASVFISSPYKVGRYSVDISAIEEVGVPALQDAILQADFVVIDEIGKMELFSRRFVKSLSDCFSSSKPVIATIGEKVISFFFSKIVKDRHNVKLVRIKPKNWENEYNFVKKLLEL